MIGPTGVGKTEISRRLSKLAEAPFVKVEATRFTEVGYVGRDVEQIVRDLIEIAIGMEKVKMRKEVHSQAQKSAEETAENALVGSTGGAGASQIAGLALLAARQKVEALRAEGKEPGRNDACFCGSGRKYKKCCGIEN